MDKKNRDIESASTLEQTYEENLRSTIKSENLEDFIDPKQAVGPESESQTIQLHARRDSESSGFELHVKEPIGSGGMANVDAAIQDSLHREVALKRAREDRCDERVISALVEEARVMGQLDHPNIPPVHQLAFNDKGEPIIIMKRVRGTSWSTLIHEPWHSYWANTTERHLKSHLGILRHVCQALEYAHSKGILHRDLKTDNVMVGDYGEVYLLDWGVAVQLNDKGEYQASHFVGTPCFAAPEMFSTSIPLTVRTDVYLLGAILHELLTRKVRHEGHLFEEVMDKVRRSEPYEYFPDVHPNLASIANKSTAQRPQLRFESVQQFREAIEHHLEHYQAIELLEKTTQLLAELTTLVGLNETDGFRLHQMAFECRFGFKRVIEVAPELKGAQEGLLKVMVLQCQYELSQGRIDAPKRLLQIIERHVPDHEGLPALQELLKSIEKKKQLSNELSTQIQYKLVEELQKKKS